LISCLACAAANSVAISESLTTFLASAYFFLISVFWNSVSSVLANSFFSCSASNALFSANLSKSCWKSPSILAFSASNASIWDCILTASIPLSSSADFFFSSTLYFF